MRVHLHMFEGRTNVEEGMEGRGCLSSPRRAVGRVHRGHAVRLKPVSDGTPGRRADGDGHPSARVTREDAISTRRLEKLLSAAHAELAQDAADMRLHRGQSDEELVRDLRVGEPLQHEAQNFLLPTGEASGIH